METNQTVQELKAERVQEELALLAEEPFRISLKAERVQEPAAATDGPEALPAFAFVLDLNVSQKLPVRIDLVPLGTVITI